MLYFSFEAENFELKGSARVTLIGQNLDRFTIQLSLGSSYVSIFISYFHMIY